MNAYNIIDGLDGLAGGTAVIVFITFLLWEVGSMGNANVILLIAVTISFLFVFLWFNVSPARVYMGDVGSLLIGAMIGFISVRYMRISLISNIILLGLFVLEGISSLLQILSLKLLKKRIFIIAPFHLHLLNRGWKKSEVVFKAWVVQILLSIISTLTFFRI
jgi:phospho-N-acetylmuramoyl-pentapeptide-transferase